MKSGQSYGYTWKAWDNTWFAGKIKKCWTSSQSVSFWRVLLFDKEAMKSPIWNRDISVESDNLLWKCSGWSCHTKNISSLIQHKSIYWVQQCWVLVTLNPVTGGALLLTTRSSWVALCVQLVEPCVVAPGLLLHSLTLPYSFPQFCHPTAMETKDQAGKSWWSTGKEKNRATLEKATILNFLSWPDFLRLQCSIAVQCTSTLIKLLEQVHSIIWVFTATALQTM